MSGENFWGSVKNGANAGVLAGGFPYARNHWYVATVGKPTFGKFADTIQQAVNLMIDGDVLHLGYGEFDESVVVTGKNKIAILGSGNFYGSRITGVGAGSLALRINGGQDVTLMNLNLEGRTTGAGLDIDGAIRRLAVLGCKLHSGAGGSGVNFKATLGGSQTVDAILRDCQIGAAQMTTGISLSVAGGDPSHRICIENNKFFAYTDDGIVSGISINLMILNNYFGNDGDTEPTRYLKLDAAGTSGLVAGNYFAMATNAIAKLALDADVIWGPNGTEAGWSTARPA